MKEIVKRLEMIKSAVSIEEDEIIDLQVTKLKSLTIDEDVQKIIKMVDGKNYEEVITHITEYINKFSGMVVFEDPQIQGLKTELGVLEKEIGTLSEVKNEYINEINTFNAEYYRHLGAIIEEILRLKQELTQKMVESGELDEEDLKETKEQYEQFYEEAISHAKEEPNVLSDENEAKLKKLYRKASRLTHPDVVADEFKTEAAEIFNDLNHAYKRKDIKEVEKILKGLESGVRFSSSSEKINDKILLRKKSQFLREKINDIKEEITALKESETYQTIQNTKNLDKYFQNLKEGLEFERDELRRELGI